MSKAKRATWWKMFSHQRAAIESVSDNDAGNGLKAAFRYFDGEDIDTESLSPAAFTVFCVIRPYMDESLMDYAESVKFGRSGGRKRWSNAASNTPSIGGDTPPIGCSTEAEAEAEAEADAEERSIIEGADKPPSRSRFSPPSVDEVRAYCQERGNNIDPQHFVDYYETNGWMRGKTKIKDWKACVRTWEKRDSKTDLGKNAEAFQNLPGVTYC